MMRKAERMWDFVSTATIFLFSKTLWPRRNVITLDDFFK